MCDFLLANNPTIYISEKINPGEGNLLFLGATLTFLH